MNQKGGGINDINKLKLRISKIDKNIKKLNMLL